MIPTQNSDTPLITIERHILENERRLPHATGDLTNLLYDIALAGKLITNHTNKAGLADVLGDAGRTNVQGETVQRLDEIANQIIFRLTDHTGRLAVMVSEENADIIPIPTKYKTGKYVLSFDPLDGSSNIDYNVSIGTIFAIHKRLNEDDDGPGEVEDCLQKGRNIVASGYILYGSSTMMVYSAGAGVNGFTLDPQIGEFLLSHNNIQIPQTPKYFSANLGYKKRWGPASKKFTEWLQGEDGGPDLSLRYIGSMVADFHRTLLSGGIFYYPIDRTNPQKPRGKLRLIYELNPLAFLMEQAGGAASDGRTPILDLKPTDLHERAPVFMGNKALVQQAEKYVAAYEN